jgi:hypothetical protein
MRGWALLNLVIWVLFNTVAAQSTRPLRLEIRGKKTGGSKGCIPISTRYIPSAIEWEWINNVKTWQDNYCQALRPYVPVLTDMMQIMEQLRQAQGLKDIKEQHRIFSMFKYSYQCGSVIVRHTTLIEPLVASLRHPLALCGLVPELESARLASRDYIMLEPSQPLQRAVQPLVLIQKPKSIMFDLGASTFLKGWGGASQKVMFESYAAKGIKFDRILLWEAGKVDPEELFRDVPPELFAHYQV